MSDHRRSVPTEDIERWAIVGWAVVCPDFDQANRTIMRWIGAGEPRHPGEGLCMSIYKGTVKLAREKQDRALELYESGLKRAAIAERLGVPSVNVSGMIQRARQRRDGAKERQLAAE